MHFVSVRRRSGDLLAQVPAGRRHLEAFEQQAWDDSTTDEGPIAEAFCRLPRAGRHDCLRTLPRGVGAQSVRLGAGMDAIRFSRGPCIERPVSAASILCQVASSPSSAEGRLRLRGTAVRPSVIARRFTEMSASDAPQLEQPGGPHRSSCLRGGPLLPMFFG